MTPPIDFSEIEAARGIRFEHFVESLLRALGWTILTPPSIGPDGGKDIIASRIETSATGRDHERRYVIQCKHYANGGRAVGPSDITDLYLVPARHQCHGWLLVASTHLTVTAIDNIEAARRIVPGVEFDAWGVERLRELLMLDECRSTLAQYLPQSYSRCAGILTPAASEMQQLVAEWIARGADRARFFTTGTDTDALLAFAISRQITLTGCRSLVTDESLTAEFLSTWRTQLARGAQTAASVLLLHGLWRLAQLRKKGLNEDARRALLCAELTMMAEHRDLKRRSWHDFIVYRGTAAAWTTVQATSKNSYMPPFPKLFGAAFVLYCEERGSAASGLVRVPPAADEIPFIASYSIESTLRVVQEFQPPLVIELMTHPGSDPVTISGIGSSEAPDCWNMLA